MNAATTIKRQQRLMTLDTKADSHRAALASTLESYLRRGDLVVVNDAGTLPASLQATTEGGVDLEVRLVQRIGPSHWRCLLLGKGSWRDDTDARLPPPTLSLGVLLEIQGCLRAHVTAISTSSERLVSLQFETDETELLSALYKGARPIQYSYHHLDLPLSWLQSPFASRPWSVEMPSAGRAITWRTMRMLRLRGVQIARLTHAAGISATGEAAQDAQLPFREHYDIPLDTVEAIYRTRNAGGRVIAIGTTVVRALEGCVAERGSLHAGEGDTSLIIDETFKPRVVDGVLAGLHAPEESHFKLLSAFATPALLIRAWTRALALGFQNHELGDALLVASQ